MLPSGLEADIAYDATEFINASIWEVGKTLIEAGLIVIVVIFLFLGNIRSTIIPVVTIPLSLVGVAVVLVAFGYSINLLTLFGLILGEEPADEGRIVRDRDAKIGFLPQESAPVGDESVVEIACAISPDFVGTPGTRALNSRSSASECA